MSNAHTGIEQLSLLVLFHKDMDMPTLELSKF